MAGLRYRVEHLTAYDYALPVTQSWQLARQTPRSLPWQRLLEHAVELAPAPNERRDVVDTFGNTVTHFTLHAAHRRLQVMMRCQVELDPRPLPPADEMPWEAVRDATRGVEPGGDLRVAQLREPSPGVPLSQAALDYAAPCFAAGRPWRSAVGALMQSIHADFAFDPYATTVSSSVEDVLQHRRGVCQDFAQLMLACLRAHGLPARYMSGYLLTDPPPGRPRLLGVDASHAWVAAFSPWQGWIEFDPTNSQRADQRYITLAWGADFADVAPLRGVILGGGEQALEVAVSVIPC